MKNTIQEKRVDFVALINSPPFQQGVRDQLAGTWRDVYGRWEDFDAAAVYETGRLATKAIGRPCRDLWDYIEACDRKAFPPNRPR